MTLKEKMDSLRPNEMSGLMYAFEEGFCFRLDLDDGSWVGVYMGHFGDLVVLETQGYWSHGIRKAKAKT